jgi:curved DNA-binding protein CbpA
VVRPSRHRARATAGQVQAAYQARLGLLAPQLLSGAPTRVLRAADTARAAADAAWQVLRDAAARQRYDEEIGARPTGTGLDTPAPVPSGLSGEIKAGTWMVKWSWRPSPSC